MSSAVPVTFIGKRESRPNVYAADTSMRSFSLLLSLALSLGISAGFPARAQQAWLGHGGDPQHTGVSQVESLPLSEVRWSTPVDNTSPSVPILIHYGSPMITAENTVLVPVRASASAYRIEARDGFDGSLRWSAPTDFRNAPSNGGWVPNFSPTLTPAGRLYFQGAGGTVYRVDDPNAASVAPVQLSFLPDYAAHKTDYDNTVFISTPITSDATGNIYFGYEVSGSAPGGLTSGIARIAPNGVASYVAASTITGPAGTTGLRLGTNSAPALSLDGAKLYVALQGSSSDFLAAIDSATLAPLHHVALTGFIHDAGTSSPTVAPDGDVFFGTLPGYHFRGTLQHFSEDLSQSFTPGSFGWDQTMSIVDADLVPSYTGTSDYLIFSKYNDYKQAGGTGVNKLAILDPNDTQIDPITGEPVMLEVLTIAGVTPDGPPDGAVKEWCINTAVVDPFTRSILANNEDGRLYRWDLRTNTLSEVITLNAIGAREAYTPTAIGPDGTVYAINKAVLFAVGAVAAPPTLTAPASGAATTSPVVVSFELPADALAGSVKLTFTGGVIRELALASSEETAGAHSFSFDPANPTASSQIASGEAIPDGSYMVTLSYRDAVTSTVASASSTNVLIDTMLPVLSLPANIIAEATSASGAVVSFNVSASDPGRGALTPNVNPPSGSAFALGTTTVNVSATDSAGNTQAGSFTVMVEDTMAPMIDGPVGGFAPRSLIVSQGGEIALPDYLPQAVTSDNVGVTSVTQSPVANTIVGEGAMLVTLTARDAAENEASVSFSVTVLVSDTAVVMMKGGSVPGAGVDPRIPAGTTMRRFGVPSITKDGQNAGWLATAMTPARRTFRGIFSGPILAPGLRVRTGEPARDDAGAPVTDVTFKSFREPVFAGDDFAFAATVHGARIGAGNDSGLWVGESGTLAEIAREGAVAPGAGVAKFVAFTSVAMPAAGTVFFTAKLGAPPSKDYGLWVWSAATGTRLVLREGEFVNLGGNPVALKSFHALTSVNGSFGHGRYVADVPALDVRLGFADPDRTTAIGTVAADGNVQVTQRSGQTDPNGRVPVSFGVPSSPGQGMGATAVTTFSPDAARGITPASAVTIYDYDGGLIRAQKGMVAPGVAPATFKSFLDPVSGHGFDGGRVQFFAATLAGAAARSGASGLWAYTGNLALVAREGAEPPDAPGTKWQRFASLSVLEGRGPMFTATLASGGARVTAANDAGLWATDSTGALRMIFREGEEIVPGKKLKSFTLLGAVSGSPGQRRAWTTGDTSARVIYRAFFIDGSSAILSTALP